MVRNFHVSYRPRYQVTLLQNYEKSKILLGFTSIPVYLPIGFLSMSTITLIDNRKMSPSLKTFLILRNCVLGLSSWRLSAGDSVGTRVLSLVHNNSALHLLIEQVGLFPITINGEKFGEVWNEYSLQVVYEIILFIPFLKSCCKFDPWYFADSYTFFVL